MTRVHGGDWAAYQELYGNAEADLQGNLPLDFSANTSPLGMPDAAREAAAASLLHADRYPDPDCRALRRAIAEKRNQELTGGVCLVPDQILCGNGAADLIDRLASALAKRLPENRRSILLPAPTFGEYAPAFSRTGFEVREYLLCEECGFRVQEDFLNEVTPNTGVVLLCEPNNPTGVVTDRSLLGKLAERCRETGTLLVVDECFLPFLEDHGDRTMLRDINKAPVLVLRAFTKFYGMAGLRIGYAVCADTDLLQEMKEAGQPWNVSTPAQEAAKAALSDTAYEERLRELIQKERPRLTAALRELGYSVIPGKANYLLFRAEPEEKSGFFSKTEGSAMYLAARLREQGILIRSCADYSGLSGSWYRIAVRTEEENRRLLRALREIAGQV